MKLLNKNLETKAVLLGLSLVIIGAIIFWPIYFFVFSGLNLIEISVFELIQFSIIELILVVVLVVFWKIYEKTFFIKK